MLEGLSSYLRSKPRRAMQIVLCLSVALVLILVAVLVSSLDIGDPFAPPYPNEVTPLSLTATGVTWTSDYQLNYFGWEYNYSDLRFSWGKDIPAGHSAFLGNVADDLQQQLLNTSSSATVEARIGGEGAVPEWIWYYLVIKDVQGDGAFGIGDTVAFRTNTTSVQPPLEDTVYTFALVYMRDGHGYGFGLGEYSCAIHDGKFYSWHSDTLSWNRPWWDL